MNSIEKWLQPPNHEKDANEFVRRVNKKVAPRLVGLGVEARNILYTLLDRSREVREMPEEAREFLNAALDEADRLSPYASQAGVTMWGDSREGFEEATQVIDEVARECNGSRLFKPLDTEEGPLNRGRQWMRDLSYSFERA